MSSSASVPREDGASGRFVGLTAEELIGWASDEFDDQLVMSTSFGIQSAVTLHLASQIRPQISVIWVDTGYLPEETYRYAETLTDVLNLNVVIHTAPLTVKFLKIVLSFAVAVQRTMLALQFS